MGADAGIAVLARKVRVCKVCKSRSSKPSRRFERCSIFGVGGSPWRPREASTSTAARFDNTRILVLAFRAEVPTPNQVPGSRGSAESNGGDS